MMMYERKYQVNIFNTDLNERLSPGMLFGFFEDLAGRHAATLGWGRDDLMSNGYFWALSRMLVRIERFPGSWEEVTLRTWPRGTETIFALRDLEMYDSAGHKIAGASSSWVVVDYNTRKAQRPDKALSNLSLPFPDVRALDTNARRIPALPAGNHRLTQLQVRLEEIDVNLHVNNARYINWAVGCHESAFVSSHFPHLIEVNYILEARRDEMINIFTAECAGEPGTFIHSVTRAADGAELCRLRMNWKENGQ